MNIISTWIYLDSPEESSEYPQVGKASHLLDFQRVYWRCVAVFFELSVQNNPNCRHILFSNATADGLPEVDGLDLTDFLKRLNVELVTLPLTWQAPSGWHGKWRNQFYIFDILAYVAGNEGNGFDEKTALLVLDSDCIVNRPLDALFGEINKHGLMALPMGFDESYNINGLTRKDMQQLFGELDGKIPERLPEYCGGEIFAATMPTIQAIHAMAPAIWREMNERFAAGRAKFNEEAHFLSYCYHKLGGYADVGGFVKRIWTSPKFTNVQDKDFDLPIWHLPAEKTGGIALIFRILTTKKNHKGKTEKWGAKELGEMLGVPKRTKYLNLKHFLKHTWLYKLATK
jgi:hypothetical protein